jgi:MFS family permease
MFFFLIFIIPCACARNIQTMLVSRFLDGVAGSAFLTVAGGTVSDLFAPAEIQAPMAIYTMAPFFGPILGPVVGGFINQFTNWRWTFYVLLIWTGVILACLIFVPETYHPVLLTRKAAALRRSTGNSKYHSASEIANRSKSLSTMIIRSLYRPFQLLFFEPMCLFLCLYSALLLGILYLFFEAFPLVFSTNHGFELWQIGLTFIGLLVGLVIGALTNPLWVKNYFRLVAKFNAANPPKAGDKPLKPDPEFRLPPTIAGSILVPIGLFWFGWTTYSSVHWIVPIIGSVFFSAGYVLA